MIEVLKLAAENVSKAYDVLAFAHTERALELLAKTRTSLRQAIAEAEKQEGQSNFCAQCEALSRELKAIKQEQGEPVASQKDAVFEASIEFIKTLTGMEPPPIEVAPPEVFKPFKEFAEKVCLIFSIPPQQRTWVGLTDDEHCDIWYKESLDWMEYGKAIEAKLKEKNND